MVASFPGFVLIGVRAVVVVQLRHTISTHNAEFVLCAGDNFYMNGVLSTADPRFKQQFTDVWHVRGTRDRLRVVAALTVGCYVRYVFCCE